MYRRPVRRVEGKMYCQNCGTELPTGALLCSSCGAHVPGHPPGKEPASFRQLLEETRRSAHDLADSTTQLTKRLASKAETAAKDPSASAKKAAKRVAKELDAAAREVERILRDL